MDFIERIFTDFSEIHGDRAYGDDEAVACGMARLGGEEVMVIGNRKGGSTKDRVRRNFGMPHPEGYRKALRCMKIAEKFGRPVISFIDLPGAYPGLGAEERGQAEAIARNLLEMARLRVPTISVITGEGGSGGALALAVADRVLILENALYFVITPESCAAIMWRDAAHKQLAAEAMRISAPEVAALGCVDEIVAEPAGGAHTDREAGAGLLGSALQKHLAELKAMPRGKARSRAAAKIPQHRPVLYGRLALVTRRLDNYFDMLGDCMRFCGPSCVQVCSAQAGGADEHTSRHRWPLSRLRAIHCRGSLLLCCAVAGPPRRSRPSYGTVAAFGRAGHAGFSAADWLRRVWHLAGPPTASGERAGLGEAAGLADGGGSGPGRGLGVGCGLRAAHAGGWRHRDRSFDSDFRMGLAGWDAAFFALAALAEEIAFRGYGFQRFELAVGPVGASLGFAAFYAIVQSHVPGSNHTSTAVSVMLGLLLSVAYLRTRALWLSWGLNFGWKASRALLFGLTVSGVNSHSPVVQGDPMGPFWLTGGGYGLDASWVAFLLMLAALPVVFRVTRDLDFRYNAPVIVPGGIPVDLDAAARRQHEAATRAAEPAAPQLIQILPAAVPPPTQPRESQTNQPGDSDSPSVL